MKAYAFFHVPSLKVDIGNCHAMANVDHMTCLLPLSAACLLPMWIT